MSWQHFQDDMPKTIRRAAGDHREIKDPGFNAPRNGSQRLNPWRAAWSLSTGLPVARDVPRFGELVRAEF